MVAVLNGQSEGALLPQLVGGTGEGVPTHCVHSRDVQVDPIMEEGGGGGEERGGATWRREGHGSGCTDHCPGLKDMSLFSARSVNPFTVGESWRISTTVAADIV